MTTISQITDPLTRFVTFVMEREAIHQRRLAGLPAPWTSNSILREWKFCNIYRENDRVTAWIRTHWREPHTDDPDLWFAMVVARFINWPDTLSELGYPVPWNPDWFLHLMADRKARKQKVYSGAYMIRADPNQPGGSTPVYQERDMFTPFWNKRELLRPRAGDTLNAYHMVLGQLFGLGSFMAAQVVADIKHHGVLKSASDWWTFAASGPGSRRGLNRVMGRSKDASWSEDNWRLELTRLSDTVALPIHAARLPRLDAQNLQNCLCEFDKYERVRLGEGTPRARFKPS